MNIGLPIAALALAGAVWSFGTPHVLAEQVCATHDGGRTCAYVLTCRYIGVQGTRLTRPEWEPEVHPCPTVAWLLLIWK